MSATQVPDDVALPDLGPRRRGDLLLSIEHLTWDYCVFRLGPAGADPVFFVRSGDEVGPFLRAIDVGEHDDELVRLAGLRTRRTLRRVPRRLTRDPAEVHLGVEHELRVTRGDDLIDFALLLPTLELGGLQADPTDRHAQRCAWGGVITADGVEAEVATPPLRLRPGSVDGVLTSAAAGRQWLEDRLPSDHRLSGWSTHINVSAGRRGDVRAAHRYCATFAPALVLLFERADSSGLLVRPRPGRLELCGEFVDGARLGATLTFAAASIAALRDRPDRFTADLVVDVVREPSRQRFGHHLPRGAFGGDLYGQGRAATLQTRQGSRTAQDHLKRCWERVRPLIADASTPGELDRVDRLVHSDEPLPANEGVSA